MQVGVKSSPDSFSAIAFILSKYRIVSSEFEEIMKLIDKEIKKDIEETNILLKKAQRTYKI